MSNRILACGLAVDGQRLQLHLAIRPSLPACRLWKNAAEGTLWPDYASHTMINWLGSMIAWKQWKKASHSMLD